MFDPAYVDDAFSKCRKLGRQRNFHPVWRASEVLVYFKAYSLEVTKIGMLRKEHGLLQMLFESIFSDVIA